MLDCSADTGSIVYTIRQKRPQSYPLNVYYAYCPARAHIQYSVTDKISKTGPIIITMHRCLTLRHSAIIISLFTVPFTASTASSMLDCSSLHQLPKRKALHNPKRLSNRLHLHIKLCILFFLHLETSSALSPHFR